MPLGTSILTARRSDKARDPEQEATAIVPRVETARRTRPPPLSEEPSHSPKISQRPPRDFHPPNGTGSRLHNELLKEWAAQKQVRPDIVPKLTQTSVQSAVPTIVAATKPNAAGPSRASLADSSRMIQNGVATPKSMPTVVQKAQGQKQAQDKKNQRERVAAVTSTRKPDVADGDPRATSARTTQATINKPKVIKKELVESDSGSEPDVAVAARDAEDSDDIDEEENFTDWDGFQVSRALPRYDERRYTLRELMTLLDTPGGIDLDPTYQRGFVWNLERQVGLVDSIFQGYYIPGLIFNKQTRMVGHVRQNRMVCIDGKQRLTSVKHFTEGRFPCRDRHGKPWYFRRPMDGEKEVRGRNYLPRAAQAALWNKTFLCYEYVGMTEEQEHELFERVQRGNPLTTAEKSQAKKGPWQDFARAFEQDYLRVMRLITTARGVGHNSIMSSFAQLVEKDRAESSVPFVPEAFRATDVYITRFFTKDVDKHPLTPELQTRFRAVFDRFEEVARSKHAFANDGLKQKATLSPVEFVAIVRMIDIYPHKTNKELAEAIRYMRRRVRQLHDDNVRKKDPVWKTLVELTDEALQSQPAEDSRNVGDATIEADPNAIENSDPNDVTDEIPFEEPTEVLDIAADDGRDPDYEALDFEDDDFVRSVAAYERELRESSGTSTSSSPRGARILKRSITEGQAGRSTRTRVM